MNKVVSRFRWALLIGFVITNALAIPGIFAPAAVADLIGARPPRDAVWPAFGFLLSFLVSWFYIPAAICPRSNLPTATLSVLGRFVTAGFWFCLYRHFESGRTPCLGWADLVIGIVQLVLLIKLVRTPPSIVT